MQLQTSISLCILKIVTHHKLNYICNFVLCNSMILGRDARDEVSTHSAIVSELESSINALQYERDNAFKQLGDVLSSHCDEEVMSKLSCEKDELASAIEALTAKLNIEGANHKQCMEELERVKGECIALTSDLANSNEANVTLELRIRQKTEDECAVDDAIASSNAQIDQLTTQVSALSEERNDLATRLTEVAAFRGVR